MTRQDKSIYILYYIQYTSVGYHGKEESVLPPVCLHRENQQSNLPTAQPCVGEGHKCGSVHTGRGQLPKTKKGFKTTTPRHHQNRTLRTTLDKVKAAGRDNALHPVAHSVVRACNKRNASIGRSLSLAD